MISIILLVLDMYLIVLYIYVYESVHKCTLTLITTGYAEDKKSLKNHYIKVFND